MEDTTKSKLEKGGKILLQTVVIVIVSAVAASLATQAAFPRLSDIEIDKENDQINLVKEKAVNADSIVRQAGRENPTSIKSSKKSEGLFPAYPAPEVSSKSYIIADADTGEVFASKNPSKILPIASITKLMTAVVARETIDLIDNITISKEAESTYGTAGGLKTGDVLTLESLYYPLLLESSNDAATAIAEHADYPHFLRLMNRKALTLNMSSTRFSDPSGLADKNTSTAWDLLQLAEYIYDKHPIILDITSSTQKLVPQSRSDALLNFTNNNPLVGRTDFLGGKNGYTDNARYTLLSFFRTSIDSQVRDIVIIVLSTESPAEDTLTLLSWTNRAF